MVLVVRKFIRTCDPLVCDSLSTDTHNKWMCPEEFHRKAEFSKTKAFCNCCLNCLKIANKSLKGIDAWSVF